MLQHSKQFGVYHWDTFDNETFLVTKNWETDEKAEFDTLDQAEEFVEEHYKGRIDPMHGADQVEIVDQTGNIIKTYKVC